MMRTTLTIDPDVARLLASEVDRSRKPLRQVVNETLRRGLSSSSSKTFRVTSHPGSLVPGIDPNRLNALADALDDQRLTRKRRPRRAV